MTELFLLDTTLLAGARTFFERGRNLTWLLGGSCTGKTAVSRWIAASTGLDVLDMDGLIYGEFMGSYTAGRHPAASRWFGADNSLDWALSLTWDEFDALNRASNAEFLDLLSRQPGLLPEDRPVLIDGGFTHPSVLARVVPATQIVTLAASDALRHHTWETAAERAAMKQWVHDLPDGRAKWQKFLYFDKMIAQTIVAESQAAGIQVVCRQEGESIESIAGIVLSAFSCQL